MKRFRGLTFKIFLLLFVSFMIAFGVVIKNKYDSFYNDLKYTVDSGNEIAEYAEYLSMKSRNQVFGYGEEHYSYEQLRNDIKNTPKSVDSVIYLLDRDGHLIEKSGFNKNDEYIFVKEARNENEESYYYIDVSSLDKTQKKLLNKNMKKVEELGLFCYFDGEIQEINNFSQSSTDMNIKEVKYYIVKPTFLHCNIDILGDMDLEKAYKGHFNWYFLDGEYVLGDPTGLTNFDTVYDLSYNDINHHIDNIISEHFADAFILSMSWTDSAVGKDFNFDFNAKNQMKYFYEEHKCFDNAQLRKIGKDYSCNIYINPIYTSTHNDLIQGYLVCFYDFSASGTDRIGWWLFDENKGLLIGGILFIVLFSYFISYLITRRIKLIDEVAMKIADNNFDIQLETKGHDELSSLSGHINTMSTNLKRNIEQLHLEIDQVKRMEELRKEFIAHFTHEIKTPLAIINGNVDLLEETKNVQKRKQYADVINKEIKVINELILQMLDLSKLEAKAITLEKENINLKELSEDIIDEYEQLLKEKRLLIQLNSEDIEIFADKRRIEMVIQNYLSNAIKHAFYQTTLQISITKQRFSIENKGKHIDDEMKEKIWLSFISNNNQGTGLGLAICKNILELHGFTYGVYNLDDGVVFYFDWNDDK